MTGSRAASVFTHGRPQETADALTAVTAAAAQAGVELRFDEEETRKHALESAAGVVTNATALDDVVLSVVLGGDGTILRALRRYAGTQVPVFAVNFGQIGFLATIEPDEVDERLARAFAGDFEVLPLPAIVVEGRDGIPAAINDVSIHRKVGGRVAQLAYALGGEEVGRVRCDGLVVATPAGSTGYNLANGGPVLAWGVEGYVVSFIAPHSLAARALVVAPTDVITVHNSSQHEAVELSVDGRTAGEIPPGEAIEARFRSGAAILAQVPGSSFYRRLREKFGRLAS